MAKSKKAMVKSTEEIFDIKEEYKSYSVDLEILYNFELEDSNMYFIGDPYNEQSINLLENGESYEEKDLIIGSNNIRDHILNKIL